MPKTLRMSDSEPEGGDILWNVSFNNEEDVAKEEVSISIDRTPYVEPDDLDTRATAIAIPRYFLPDVPSQIICKFCRKPGHIVRDCPSKVRHSIWTSRGLNENRKFCVPCVMKNMILSSVRRVKSVLRVSSWGISVRIARMNKHRDIARTVILEITLMWYESFFIAFVLLFRQECPYAWRSYVYAKDFPTENVQIKKMCCSCGKEGHFTDVRSFAIRFGLC